MSKVLVEDGLYALNDTVMVHVKFGQLRLDFIPDAPLCPFTATAEADGQWKIQYELDGNLHQGQLSLPK